MISYFVEVCNGEKGSRTKQTGSKASEIGRNRNSIPINKNCVVMSYRWMKNHQRSERYIKTIFKPLQTKLFLSLREKKKLERCIVNVGSL